MGLCAKLNEAMGGRDERRTSEPIPTHCMYFWAGIGPEGYSRQTVNQWPFCGRLQLTFLTHLDGRQPFAKNKLQVQVLFGAGGGVKT